MRLALSYPLLLVVSALGAVSCAGAETPPAKDPPTAIPLAAAPTTAREPKKEHEARPEKALERDDDAKTNTPSDPSNADKAPRASETRTMEVIRQLVMDNRKAARKCYLDARLEQKDLKGDVTIHFVLDPAGNVKSADLNKERSTLDSPRVVDCVIGVIKAIKFPRSSRAMETSANYPFNFTP